MKEIIRDISIIGYGNVGFHLSHALIKAGVNVSHIYSRNTHNFKSNEIDSEIVSSLSDLPNNQLILLCVPDQAISSLLEQIDKSCPVAYTSGSVQLDNLPGRDNLGVFYPLQTFTKNVPLDISEIPFFIESNNKAFEQQLFDTASLLSKNVTLANSEEREKLHVTAVYVNNFSNHIIHLAQEFAKENKVDFKYLIPLLKETALKLEHSSAYSNQTGPARRQDNITIYSHLNQLSDEQKEIYTILTESIQKTYSK